MGIQYEDRIHKLLNLENKHMILFDSLIINLMQQIMFFNNYCQLYIE